MKVLKSIVVGLVVAFLAGTSMVSGAGGFLGNKVRSEAVDTTAESSVTEFSYTDPYTFVADCLTYGVVNPDGTTDGVAAFSSAIVYDYTYRLLAEAIIEEDGLLETSVFWKCVSSGLDGNFGEMTSWQKNFYEVMLLDYLTYVEGTEQYEDNFAEKTLKFTYDIADTLIGEKNDIYEGTVDELIENQSLMEACAFSDKYGYIYQLNEYSTLVGDLMDFAGSVKEYYENLSKALALQEINQGKVDFLLKIKKAGADDPYLCEAVDEIIEKYEASYSQICLGEAWDTMYKYSTETVWGWIVEDNPYLATVQLGKKALDCLFNTDELTDHNLKMTILYIINSKFMIATQSLRDAYWENPTVDNARQFDDAFCYYVDYQKYATSYADGFVSSVLFNGWYNKIKNIFSDENEITYEIFKGYFQSDISFCGQLDKLNRNFYKLYYAYKGEEGNSTTDYYKNKITTTLTLNQDMVLCGNVLMSANVNLNGHTLTIYGNLHQTNGYMYINSGNLNVTGDYKIQKIYSDGGTGNSSGTLNMLKKNDYVKIKGDFVIQSSLGYANTEIMRSGYNQFTAGTMEIWGDFYQYNGSKTNFKAQQTHVVAFNGKGSHVVHFDSIDSNFGIIKSINEAAITISKYFSLTLYNHLTLGGDIRLNGNINLNGYSLTITGDLEQAGDLYINGGNLVVEGDLKTSGDIESWESGKLNVHGNIIQSGYMHVESGVLSVGKTLFIDGGNLIVEGDLKEYEELYVCNGGNLIKKGDWTTIGNIYIIEDGKIDVRGKMIQSGELSIAQGILNVEGDMIQTGNISLPGTVNVKGNLYQTDGIMCINGGMLNVIGDYKIQDVYADGSTGSSSGTVKMLNELDYVKIGGDFVIQSNKFACTEGESCDSCHNHFMAGTLEIGGGFYQYMAGDVDTNFFSSSSHRVVFKGVGSHVVYFDSMYSSLGLFELIDGATITIPKYFNIILQNNLTLEGIKELNGIIYLNGYTLTVKGDLELSGELFMEGYHSYGGKSGGLIIEGNLQTSGYIVDEIDDNMGGKIVVHGNMTQLQSGWMTVSPEVLNVRGNFEQGGTIGIYKGNLVVEGDLKQSGEMYLHDGGNLIVKGDLIQTTDYYGYIESWEGDIDVHGNVIQSQWAMISLAQGMLNVGKDFEQYEGILYVSNGIIEGSFKQYKGDLNISYETLTINGDFEQTGRLELYDKGHLIIKGDLRTTGDICSSLGGKIDVYGSILQSGEMNLEQGVLNVNGDMTQSGNISLSGTMNIKGNLYQANGYMYINGGTLNVIEDYKIQKIHIDGSTGSSDGTLHMLKEGDYVKIGGDFVIQSTKESCDKTVFCSEHNQYMAGKIEIGEDFYQYLEDSCNFVAGTSHKVVFKGTGSHVAHFDSVDSHFGLFELENGATITIPNKFSITLQNNWTLNGDRKLNGKIHLNGYTLRINGDLEIGEELILEGGHLVVDGDLVTSGNICNFADGKIDVHGSMFQSGEMNLEQGVLNVNGDMKQSGNISLSGTMNIMGNLYQTNGYMYINGGTLNVIRDYKIQRIYTDGSTGSSDGTLHMLKECDYVKVGGDFVIQSTKKSCNKEILCLEHNQFMAGVIEIGGGFYQYSGNTINFEAYSSHKVIFKKAGKHNVYFQSPNSNFATVQVHKSADCLILSCDNCYTNLIVEPCTYNETVTKQPNFSEEGEKIYTCTICGDTYTETIPKIKPAKVAGVTAVYQDGQIVLTWEDTGAAQYRVMRYDGTSGYSTLTFRATAAGYTDSNLIDAHRYYYRICGYYYDADGRLVQGAVSDAVGVVATDRNPSKVENVTVSVSDGNITLTWDAADGSRYYKISRAYGATASEGSYACLKYNIEETTYTDTTIPSTGTYRYKVVGYYKAVDGNWVYGDLSDTLFVTIE